VCCAREQKGRNQLIPKSTFQFVDVRDVANAHVNAISSKVAAGKRYLAVAGCVPMVDVVDLLSRLAPESKCPTMMEDVSVCVQSVMSAR